MAGFIAASELGGGVDLPQKLVDDTAADRPVTTIRLATGLAAVDGGRAAVHPKCSDAQVVAITALVPHDLGLRSTDRRVWVALLFSSPPTTPTRCRCCGLAANILGIDPVEKPQFSHRSQIWPSAAELQTSHRRVVSSIHVCADLSTHTEDSLAGWTDRPVRPLTGSTFDGAHLVPSTAAKTNCVEPSVVSALRQVRTCYLQASADHILSRRTSGPTAPEAVDPTFAETGKVDWQH
eukprot:CAMPEP_0194769872 /NCGR_PEP_ID=MMETSP0323_2-20130528/44502_1 /TAXON_ID=2866 ORGANISM="Crypthecodinium cohnii, Strain Seligo" /NCGR_SAMPLE_ID=MMETSP0323_2 /ASSEMBLY_ACC=CAM_ASM_000346 /LENGTH=235 /DNA_ID=CAMNT_0039703113 /DNA_START=131 /DNA_END=839 /DNA_ORIENTATION=-